MVVADQQVRILYAGQEVARHSQNAGRRVTVFERGHLDGNVPREAAVFKDPETAKVRIYTNDAGKELIERLAGDAGLTGLECGLPRRY